MDLEHVARELGVSLLERILSGPFIGALSIEAAALRQEQLKIGYDPTTENDCHGQAWGNMTNKKMLRRLLARCSWYLEIAGVSVGPE